jgi:nucleotide-binding universal stress UspA family protein
MLRTLLVPLDGSRFGEHALPLALTVARKSNAAIHLLHAHQPLDAPYAELVVFDDTLDSQMKTRERDYLEHTAKEIARHYQGPVSFALEDGHTASVIERVAAERRVDLIVQTTHARGPLARFWLGSVTDELIRKSNVPLLLAHPKDEAVDLARDVPLRHWLAPLDGTPHSEHILPILSMIAEPLDPEFTFLRVLRPVSPMMVPAAVGGFAPIAEDVIIRVESVQADVEKEAAEYLARIAAPYRSKARAVHTVVMTDDNLGEAILHRSKMVDAIALGTHGRHGLSRMLWGSVADNVIRGAQVPILVLRHAG